MILFFTDMFIWIIQLKNVFAENNGILFGIDIAIYIVISH